MFAYSEGRGIRGEQNEKKQKREREIPTLEAGNIGERMSITLFGILYELLRTMLKPIGNFKKKLCVLLFDFFLSNLLTDYYCSS